MNESNARSLHQRLDAATQLFNNLLLALNNLLELKLETIKRYAEYVSMLHGVYNFCVSTESLCWYTAAVQACATSLGCFNDGHGESMLRSIVRSTIASGARTYNDKICFSHFVYSLY